MEIEDKKIVEKFEEQVIAIKNLQDNALPFWHYLANEHNLVLVDSELDELQNNAIKNHPILKKAMEMREAQVKYFTKGRTKYDLKVAIAKEKEFDNELRRLTQNQ